MLHDSPFGSVMYSLAPGWLVLLGRTPPAGLRVVICTLLGTGVGEPVVLSGSAGLCPSLVS